MLLINIAKVQNRFHFKILAVSNSSNDYLFFDITFLVFSLFSNVRNPSKMSRQFNKKTATRLSAKLLKKIKKYDTSFNFIVQKCVYFLIKISSEILLRLIHHFINFNRFSLHDAPGIAIQSHVSYNSPTNNGCNYNDQNSGEGLNTSNDILNVKFLLSKRFIWYSRPLKLLLEYSKFLECILISHKTSENVISFHNCIGLVITSTYQHFFSYFLRFKLFLSHLFLSDVHLTVHLAICKFTETEEY